MRSWTRAGWTYALPDALGSVRQAVDGSGAMVDAREWSPYGVEVGTAQPGLGYTGEWWDAAVGLQYLRAMRDEAKLQQEIAETQDLEHQTWLREVLQTQADTRAYWDLASWIVQEAAGLLSR